jgi:thiol-disulfide isomerase/thioredoxin
MKNKVILIVLIGVFVLLIGGAAVLYSRLGDQLQPDRLEVQNPPATTAPATTAPTGPLQTDPAVTTAPAQTTRPVITAPDFTVYDAEGNEVHLSDYFGKPIVLNFWASWCGPCQMEMPDFQEKYLELGEEVAFLMINMTDGGRETVQTASEFIASKDYTFPVFYDTMGMAAGVYGAYSLPTSYFINAQGHVIARAVGAIDGETLQRGIDMIR